ncbi:MAG TPA: PaaI family thioesterase [Rhodothermales bacterium]|nr:PaaI family thioesterase [Rhodothermales bacterium]
MNGEYVSFTENRILVCRFPNDPRFQNPIGLMQGGFIVAAIDNTLGPLSYLVAPPSVTTQLNTTYLRPVTMRDTYLDVHGEVLEQSKSYLHMRATVLNPSGKKNCTGLLHQSDFEHLMRLTCTFSVF